MPPPSFFQRQIARPDHSAWLHFLPGNPRLPLGISFIGKAAITGDQIMHRDLTKPGSDEELNDWMREEEIMACGATPIKFKGEVLGIIAGYTRERIPDEAHTSGGRYLRSF